MAANIRVEPFATNGAAHPPNAAVTPFTGAIDQLLAELDCLMLVLYHEVLRLRAAGGAVEDQFRGLYVSDEHVDSILGRAAANERADADRNAAASVAAIVEEQRDRLAGRARATSAAGIELPLERLAAIFRLDPFERLALVTCVATEVDPRFETLFSYVQNDVNRKRPTAGLLLQMFSDSPAERFSLRSAFSADATLVRHQLIRPAADPHRPDQSTLARPLHADERIVEFLLGHDAIDDRLRNFAAVVEPLSRLSSLELPPELSAGLSAAANTFADQGAVLFLCGPRGAGKRAAAEALSLDLHRRLIVANLPSDGLPEALALLQREALLQDANLLLHGEALSGANGAPPRPTLDLARHLCPAGRLIFVASESPWVDLNGALDWPALWFDFPIPSFEQRERLWAGAIRQTAIQLAPAVDLAALANKYVLTGGEIREAANSSAYRAMARGETDPQITTADLEAAARSQSNQGLRRLAQKIETCHALSDLVLPPRAIQQLRQVCATHRYRQVVYSEWGFHHRVALGKGLNVLFCGPSGTGKTMAAGVLARELALDLYKIDLSTVVSKYIGETEKQLDRIFRQAQSSNAVLFFDEADALFGKRTEVKDAHDRYANVEVGYLLQKMEEYEGIVILATNYRRNMDDAFVRRMHHIVEFPMPDAECRERIWTGLLPADAPLAADVDFRFLARQFELPGGNIRNIVLAAAFLAAEERAGIRMEHFILALARELQKMGRLPSRSDFREYFELIRGRA